MSDKTILMDGSNPDRENAERTRIVSEKSFKETIVQEQTKVKTKFNILKKMGLFAGGIASASALMSFAPSRPEVTEENEAIILPDEPNLATGVNDSMTYEEAWDTAREEVGQGGYFVWNDQPFSTYSHEEWAEIPNEDKDEFTTNMKQEYQEFVNENPTVQPDVVVYDQAPVADNISDDMSFGDAFALAREDVGAGGAFVWRGKVYGTYYKEEYDSMDAEDKAEFASSTANLVADNQAPEINTQINETTNVVAVQESEVFVKDEMVQIEGKDVHVGYFMKDGNPVVKLDIDNDNNYDYILDESSNQLVGLNGNSDIDLKQPEGTSSNVVMTEETNIGGYDALLTVYSDGSQSAKLDLDGDGNYDSTVNVDQNGHMELYDNTGNLIGEQDIPENNPIDDLELDPIEEYDVLANNFGDDFNNHGDISDFSQDDGLV